MAMSRLKCAVLLSYACLASVSAAIITPALPHIEKTYSLSHGALEWVISIFLVGYVFGQLIYAPIANRFGRLSAFRLGLFINIVGIVVCLIANSIPSYSLLLVGRLVTALGAACGLSCTFLLINELYPPEKAKHIMSYAVIPFPVGIGLAVTVGGLVTQYWQWQDSFWILLVHGLLMFALTWVFTETLQTPIQINLQTLLAGYWSALKNKQLIIFGAILGFVSVYNYGFSAAAPIYTQSILHLTPSQYGYWNLLNMLGMLSAGFISAYFIKQYGVKQVLLSGFVLLIPCILSLLFIAFFLDVSVVWFFVTTALLYLLTGLLFPAASYLASNAMEDRASASSMMSFINMGLGTLSVVIIGYLPFESIRALVFTIILFYVLTVPLAVIQLSHFEKK